MRYSADLNIQGSFKNLFKNSNIQGSSKNFFKDQNNQSIFDTLVFLQPWKQNQEYQGKISNPLAGLEFDNRDNELKPIGQSKYDQLL